MTRFGLNTKKANNYAFFCPVSKLHLTRSNPIGVTDGVTPAILRGLKSNVILDLDNAVDLATGTLKTGQTPPLPSSDSPANPPKSDETNSNQGDAPKRGRGRRKNQASDQESDQVSDQVSDQDNDEELTGLPTKSAKEK